MLGHGHRVSAPIVGDGDLGPARRFDVEPVIAGADELHQLELRHGAVEIGSHPFAGEPQEELGVAGPVQGIGREPLDDLEIVPVRHHGSGDVHDGLG